MNAQNLAGMGAPMLTEQQFKLPKTTDERSRLRMLLRLAAASLHWGFVGGEWSAAMPDEVSLGAAKEHDEAVWVMELIRKELAEGEAKLEVPPASDTTAVTWTTSSEVAFVNDCRVQIYPSPLNLGWWEFFVERDPFDPNERIKGQATSKELAKSRAINLAFRETKDWK